MYKSKLKKILNFLKDKSILITTHDTADLDGFASSFALLFFLKQVINKSKKIDIYFSSVGKSVLEFSKKVIQLYPESNLTYLENFNPEDYDIMIILDTNNISQVILPNNLTFSDIETPFLFIDHHFINEKNMLEGNASKFNLIDDMIPSTSEILFELYQEYSINIPIIIKFLLIAGIISDTGHFKYATSKTFKRVSKLLKDDIDYQGVLLSMEKGYNYSERIALIKGAQRVKLIKENNWLIGVSHVGSFESHVASNLLKLGFDVAVVYSDKSGEYRISTRAKKDVCVKTGLHLGRILEKVSSELEASGGGHDGAASLTIKNEYEKALDRILQEIKNILEIS